MSSVVPVEGLPSGFFQGVQFDCGGDILTGQIPCTGSDWLTVENPLSVPMVIMGSYVVPPLHRRSMPVHNMDYATWVLPQLNKAGLGASVGPINILMQRKGRYFLGIPGNVEPIYPGPPIISRIGIAPAGGSVLWNASDYASRVLTATAPSGPTLKNACFTGFYVSGFDGTLTDQNYLVWGGHGYYNGIAEGNLTLVIGEGLNGFFGAAVPGYESVLMTVQSGTAILTAGIAYEEIS